MLFFLCLLPLRKQKWKSSRQIQRGVEVTCSLRVPAVGVGNAQLALAHGTEEHAKGWVELVG